MAVNTDTQNQYIDTTDAETLPLPVSINQNVFERITVKLMCWDVASERMASFIIQGLVQRATGSTRMAGSIKTVVEIDGDSELLSATATIEALGGGININVTGVDGYTLKWCAQISTDAN